MYEQSHESQYVSEDILSLMGLSADGTMIEGYEPFKTNDNFSPKQIADSLTVLMRDAPDDESMWFNSGAILDSTAARYEIVVSRAVQTAARDRSVAESLAMNLYQAMGSSDPRQIEFVDKVMPCILSSLQEAIKWGDPILPDAAAALAAPTFKYQEDAHYKLLATAYFFCGDPEDREFRDIFLTYCASFDPQNRYEDFKAWMQNNLESDQVADTATNLIKSLQVDPRAENTSQNFEDAYLDFINFTENNELVAQHLTSEQINGLHFHGAVLYLQTEETISRHSNGPSKLSAYAQKRVSSTLETYNNASDLAELYLLESQAVPASELTEDLKRALEMRVANTNEDVKASYINKARKLFVDNDSRHFLAYLASMTTTQYPA
jgi:hypothetical protein